MGQKRINRKTSRRRIRALKDISGSLSFAGTIAGGLLVAFSYLLILYIIKGQNLVLFFTYIGAAAICRIPMTLFEISFMGVKFSMIRLLVFSTFGYCYFHFIRKIFNQKKL